jgi:hypothetical protein
MFILNLGFSSVGKAHVLGLLAWLVPRIEISIWSPISALTGFYEFHKFWSKFDSNSTRLKISFDG